MQRVLTDLTPVRQDGRITSAHAESTKWQNIWRSHRQDHLCACREYRHVITSYFSELGSPLRMQRVQALKSAAAVYGGITSAHAESTGANPDRLHCAKDHLCACREYEL